MKKKSTHGGARPGAGGWNRSPYGPLTRTTVQLSDDVRAFLKSQESQGGYIETVIRSTVEFMLWKGQQRQ